jgi:hypothetical protein
MEVGMSQIVLRPGLTWDTLPVARVVTRLDPELVLDILDMVQRDALGLRPDEVVERIRKEVLYAAGMDADAVVS